MNTNACVSPGSLAKTVVNKMSFLKIIINNRFSWRLSAYLRKILALTLKLTTTSYVAQYVLYTYLCFTFYYRTDVRGNLNGKFDEIPVLISQLLVIIFTNHLTLILYNV